ncbi:MAG: hypothetical protein ABH863_05950 [Candidatus Micrarchaeota archaeon]
MRPLFAILLLSLLLFTSLSSAMLDVVNKQIAEPMPYVATAPQATDSYYQAIFDERGQALVLARLELSNYQREPVTEITLEIPGNSVSLKYALQASPSCTQQCAKFDKVCTQSRKVCDVWDYSQDSCTTWRDECQSYQSQCVQYTQKCSGSIDSNSATYKLVDVQKIGGNTFRIMLDSPIGSGEKSALLLSYRVFGYVTDGFTKDFDFQTIKAQFDIDYSRVSISVDKDLELKGGQSRTDYVTGFNTFESQMASAPKADAISGSSLGIANSIRYATGYVKEKRNLLPNESFHVTGSFADAGWKLYILDWLFWLAVVLLILYGCWKFCIPKIISLFESFAPQASKKPQKNAGFDASRAIVAAFISATAYAILSLVFMAIFLIASSMRIIASNTSAIFLVFIILAGIVGVVLLFLYANSRFGTLEAIVTSISFIGISVVMVPVAIFLLYIVSMVLFGQYF